MHSDGAQPAPSNFFNVTPAVPFELHLLRFLSWGTSRTNVVPGVLALHTFKIMRAEIECHMPHAHLGMKA